MSNRNCGQVAACIGCPILASVEARETSFSESVQIGTAAFNLNQQDVNVITPIESFAVLRSLGIDVSEEKMEALRSAVRWQATTSCQEDFEI